MAQTNDTVEQVEEELAEAPLTLESVTDTAKLVLKSLWSTQKEVAGKVQENLVVTMARILLVDQINNKIAKHKRLDGVFLVKNLGWAPLTEQFVLELTWAPRIVSLMDETLTVRFPVDEIR